VESIRRAYDGHYRTMDGHRYKIYVTDTLATRIILGTPACVPAYDSLVVKGLHLERIPYSALNQRTLEALFAWYLNFKVAPEPRLDDDSTGFTGAMALKDDSH
jgi:hypothetical protein